VSGAASAIVFGAKYRDALAFAAEQHQHQHRKGSGAPYVTHVLAVSALVGEYGGDEEQAVAALLHDVVEDQGVALVALEARFGAEVARLVEAATDAFAKPKPPWRARKEAHIARVRTMDARPRLVIAADKLHNTQSILRDLGRPLVGASVWGRFNAGKEGMLWYVDAMHHALADGWQHEILHELEDTSARLRGASKT
jgi:(p)ppGpp synthase/HD superfamily hydrolase